jgi:hypothetical protein
MHTRFIHIQIYSPKEEESANRLSAPMIPSALRSTLCHVTIIKLSVKSYVALATLRRPFCIERHDQKNASYVSILIFVLHKSVHNNQKKPSYDATK